MNATVTKRPHWQRVRRAKSWQSFQSLRQARHNLYETRRILARARLFNPVRVSDATLKDLRGYLAHRS